MLRYSWLRATILSIFVGGAAGSCSDGAETTAPPAPSDPSVYEQFSPLVEVLEYKPATGQFVVADSWDDCDYAYERLSGGNYLSLGAWGGFVSVGFGAGVLNGEGEDIAIKGNPFATSNEPGVVWVSVDVNENGVCDDVWYELKGSEFESSVRGYTKTYEGVDYTFSGTKLPSNATETATDYWVLSPFDWGYADNSGSDMDGGYNLFDIDNAVDAAGDVVELEYIDFVRVQCGVEAEAGALGEVSTEVLYFLARTE